METAGNTVSEIVPLHAVDFIEDDVNAQWIENDRRAIPNLYP